MRSFLLCIIVAGLLAAPSGQVKYTYSVQRIDLPPLDKLPTAYPVPIAVNDTGEILALKANLGAAVANRVYVWTNGSATELGTLSDHPWSIGTSINAAGDVAGYSYFDVNGPRDRAFRWHRGKLMNVGPSDGRGSEALHVDPEGRVLVVVYPHDRSTPFQDRLKGVELYAWKNGTSRAIGRFDKSLLVLPRAANSQMQVIGHLFEPGAKEWSRAFLWKEGRLVALTAPGGRRTAANFIGETGVTVGFVEVRPYDSKTTRPPIHHAAIWVKERMQDLGTLRGKSSEASGTNDAGLVVGSSEVAQNRHQTQLRHAFLWDSVRGMRDINNLASYPDTIFTGAAAINNRGQILCSGRPSTQADRRKTSIFLLTPR